VADDAGTNGRHVPRRPPPAAPRLRPMRWWDIPAVTVLEHAAFPDDAWSVGMFWSELAETATRYYLVAEEHGRDEAHPDALGPRIVGYAGLLAGAGEAEVQTIAVDPAREGFGLGATLLTELLSEAARRGCDDVVLEVRADNARAQELYRRFGFVQVGLRRGYYQPANVDALIMRAAGVTRRYDRTAEEGN
jgi:ribosomal-protein-alanine N-acetyltransferase